MPISGSSHILTAEGETAPSTWGGRSGTRHRLLTHPSRGAGVGRCAPQGFRSWFLWCCFNLFKFVLLCHQDTDKPTLGVRRVSGGPSFDATFGSEGAGGAGQRLLDETPQKNQQCRLCAEAARQTPKRALCQGHLTSRHDFRHESHLLAADRKITFLPVWVYEKKQGRSIEMTATDSREYCAIFT